MQKKLRFLFFIALYSGLHLYAQQEVQLTHHMFGQMNYNPGYAGSQDAICASAILRQQWVGFKDIDGNKVAPETYVFAAHAPIRFLHGGVGLSVVQDQIGFFKNIHVKLSYAYQTDFADGKLGIGLQGGFYNNTLDFSKFNAVDDGDAMLKGSEESNLMGDFGMGLYYQVPERYYLSLSTTRLLEATKDLGASEQPAQSHFKRHYFLSGGYYYLIPRKPAYRVEPSFLIKTDGAITTYDIATLLRYNDKFYGGLNYRYQDAVSFLVGLAIKDLEIGYSYDLTTSKLAAVSSGSHEVMLRYRFKLEFKKARTSYKNTRFL